MIEHRSPIRHTFLPFEEPLRPFLEQRELLAQQLTRAHTDSARTVVIRAEMEGLNQAIRNTWVEEVEPNIGDWETVLLARHPQRPHTLDYIYSIFNEFMELHGDRRFLDDKAVVGGLAKLESQTVMIIGTQKGKDARENAEDQRRFGMPRAEGYRKALRLMKHAEKFGFPVITFIDLPGASPDAESEERGIAVAIAENIFEMAQLKTPTIAVVIGEGGSGGALALAVADRLLALQYTYFTVVSPEGAASILWRDAKFAPQAAEQLKLAARNLPKFLSYARLLKEPHGGVHRFPREMYPILKTALIEELGRLKQMSIEELLENRYQQFRHTGEFIDPSS